MARNFVYLDRFQAGETGQHGDWLDGYKLFRGILIYNGTWHGHNVRRNLDGSLGPRPGLFPVPVTGLPTGPALGYGSTGFPGRDGWVVIGTTLYLFNHLTGGAAVAVTGSFASTPTAPVVGIQSGPTFLYLTSQGDRTYVCDLNALTLTPIPFGNGTPQQYAPGGKCITIYNQRLVIGNLGGSNTNRIIFSDPMAPGYTPGNYSFDPTEAVPSLTFFDCGDGWDVNFLGPQRTHLAIGKQTGWWVYQGEPGLNAVLRQALPTTDGPKEPLHAALTRSGAVWYIPLFVDLPAAFTGSAIQQATHLRFAGGKYTQSLLPPSFGVQAMAKPSDIFMVAGNANTAGQNKAAELHNGAWAFHNFEIPVSGFTAFGTVNGVYLCDGGAPGVAPKFFIYPTEIERPVKFGDVFGTVQDGATPAVGNIANENYVELPEWESRDGSEVVVRAVLVGFKKWNTGFTQTNHFDLNVVATRQFGKAGAAAGTIPAQGQVSQLQSFDEAAVLTQQDAQYQEVAFRFGDQMTGNGFKLVLSNLRGVAISKIQVIVDQNPTRV